MTTIWGATDRGPATGTMKVPVDINSSSSPGNLSISEIATFTWASPTLVTPALGTPSSGTLTNTTGFPTANLAGAGTGVLTALGVNVGSAGAPVLFNGAGGTPSSLTATNLSGTAASLTAGNVTTNANLTGDVTSSGNASTIALSVAHNWTGQQTFAAAALTDASPITWNLATQQAATVLLTSGVGATRQLANPTNMVNGGTYTLKVTQSSTGTNALTYGNAYKWPGGTAPTLSTANNAVDILTFLSDGTSMFGVSQLAFS